MIDAEEAKSLAAPDRKKDRFSMYIVGGTGDTGFVPFDVYALHILPAPYQEDTKGNMYSKLSFKWDSARHGMLRKPFKTWKAFHVQLNNSKYYKWFRLSFRALTSSKYRIDKIAKMFATAKYHNHICQLDLQGKDTNILANGCQC